ncbi:MAG: M6 family metalloprotease domain-containing protein [Prevotella sp.]|nr:M6 family metalloprotease domain-containing protein [Prevotella sp.]
MKRFLLSVIASLLIVSGIQAAKANSQPMTFTQPDGSKVTVVLHGDEHFHWYTTSDGVIINYVNGAFYVANIEADGTTYPTTQLVHDAELRTQKELSIIAQQQKDQFKQATDSRWNAPRREPLDNRKYVVHQGHPKSIVVLAQYSDVKFTLPDPLKSFNQLFNSTEDQQEFDNGESRNHGSVRQYFNDMSHGAYQPEFTVVGPVTLPNTMSYYGNSPANSASGEKTVEMVKDAAELAAGLLDLSLPEYDANGDGKIDHIYVIYAGYGQNYGGPAESVWAKTNTLSATINGHQLTWYSVASELNINEEYWKSRNLPPQINGIGVICHEFSHAMGLADTYPTVSEAHLNNQEMEFWDLMDGGEYVNNGYRPTAYNAWECEVMEWSAIETLENSPQQLQLSPVLDEGKAYRFLNEESPNEYFVLENIQKKGWNSSLPGHGLLVYHVKWPKATVSMNDHPNNTPGEPGMAVVPADGILLSSYINSSTEYFYSHQGDPFPGTSEVNSLTYAQQLPNYRWYSGQAEVKQTLSEITEDAETGVITLNFLPGGTDAILKVADDNDAGDAAAFTLDGRRAGKNDKGIIVTSKKKYIRR